MSIGFDVDQEYSNVLPEGWYTVAVTGAELTEPSEKAPQGVVRVKLRVVEGEHSGRESSQMFGLWSSNPTAKAIAQQGFKKVCVACGLSGTLDTLDPLLNKVFRCKLKVTAGKQGGLFQNLADAKSMSEAIEQGATADDTWE